jgi:hypothetical protein
MVLVEVIGDKYATSDKIQDAWRCPLGEYFAHAVGEMGTSPLHAMYAIHVFVNHLGV